MKLYKLAIILYLFLINTSCSVDKRNFRIEAYDSLGFKISKSKFLVSFDDIDSFTKSYCKKNSGAKLEIINNKTNQKLQNKSPYQCQGKNFIRKFNPPRNFNFNNKNYKLAYVENTNNANITTYEYFSENEIIHNWSTMISISYFKSGKFWRPKLFINSMQSKAAKINAFIKYESNEINAFIILIISPSKNNNYYESNMLKSFHLVNCDGLVTISFNKKYQPKSKMRKDFYVDNILKDGIKISEKLKKNLWLPVCSN